MGDGYRQNRPDSRSSGSDFGSVADNEKFILSNGLSGSVDEFKKACSDAAAHPGETIVKVGIAATVAGVAGFCAGRAGIAGLLARGAISALGTQFVLDTLVPLGTSALAGFTATNSRELHQASHRLSVGLGRLAFDTMVSMPFAMAGSLAGRGLRSAVLGGAEASTAAEATAAARESRTAARDTRSTAGRETGRASHSSTWEAPRRPRVVVEGELLDPEPTASRWGRRTEPEIIDAEFTVVEPKSSISRRSLAHIPSLKAESPALLGMTSDSTALATRTAETSLEAQIPVQLRTVARPTTPSPDAVRRALDAYAPPKPPTGLFVDVKA